MKLKELVLNHINDDDFDTKIKIGDTEYIINIGDGELEIETFIGKVKTHIGEVTPRRRGPELTIGDLDREGWDDEDWEEFHNFPWPEEEI